MDAARESGDERGLSSWARLLDAWKAAPAGVIVVDEGVSDMKRKAEQAREEKQKAKEEAMKAK